MLSHSSFHKLKIYRVLQKDPLELKVVLPDTNTNEFNYEANSEN